VKQIQFLLASAILAGAKRSAKASRVSALCEANGCVFRTDRIVSYDTKNDTNAIGTDTPGTEVEEMVGSWRLEPQTSTVSKPHDYIRPTLRGRWGLSKHMRVRLSRNSYR
jgi:hypothetical protein